MKKILITFLGLTSMLTASAQQLSGQLTGIKNGKLLVRVINDTNTDYEKKDTIAVTNGNFTYNYANLQTCKVVYVSTIPSSEGERAKTVQAYLYPDQECVLTGGFDEDNEVKLTGGIFAKGVQASEDALKPFSDKMNAISKEYRAKVEVAGADKKALQEELEAKYSEASKEYREANKKYIQAHASEDASAIACMDLENPLEGFAMLTNHVKNGPMKSFIDSRTTSIKKQQEREAKLAEARKNLQPGMPAPDFTLNDLDGKPLSLSQLKGKYVILDWWGSWCIWCIRGIPKMLEYYAKYSDKMEILGIDCNDTDAKWREAVKKYELPWKHVYKPKDSKLTELYAIEGYPTKMIINPDGTFNKIIIGEDPEFYNYLDELLK